MQPIVPHVASARDRLARTTAARPPLSVCNAFLTTATSKTCSRFCLDQFFLEPRQLSAEVLPCAETQAMGNERRSA